MTLIILFTLVLIGVLFTLRNWRRTGQTLHVISLILFLAIGCGPVPTWLMADQAAYTSMVPHNWASQNTIVLLGVGIEAISNTNQFEAGAFSYGRIVKAASLYNECKKSGADCKVLASGGDVHHSGNSEAAIYGSVLTSLGVRNSDLILEAKSKNTWQNAQFSSALLKNGDSSKIFLVTSGIHLCRSLLYFSHFGLTPTPIRADYYSPIISLVPNAYNFTLVDIAIHEQVGIARFYLYNYFGWNSAATLPKSL